MYFDGERSKTILAGGSVASPGGAFEDGRGISECPRPNRSRAALEAVGGASQGREIAFGHRLLDGLARLRGRGAEFAEEIALRGSVGWSPDGAVCVHHVRVKENVTLAELEMRYPKLAGRTGAVCTEEFARANGAILYNRSGL